MVPEICQNILIRVVPNFLTKIAATLPKSPISEPPICILALTNYKTCIGLFPKLSPTYCFRNPKFFVAEKKWKAIHLLWRQAGSANYLWQTCLNVGYRLYLQTYYLTQAVRRIHPPRTQTYLLVWIVLKDKLSNSCILLEQLCAQIKTMDQCPRDLIPFMW